jgi:NADH-quinone oxidoreductase subunit N
MDSDFRAILPFIILGATPVLIVLGIALARSYALSAAVCLAGLAAAFISLLIALPQMPVAVTKLFVIDHYGAFYAGLVIAASFAVSVYSYGYFKRRGECKGEFFALLSLAAGGSATLAISSHFASFFLGLEVLGVSLYAMLAFLRTEGRSIEAGMKYLILAAVSSSFILFGMALIYSETGTMEFIVLASALGAFGSSSLVLAGLGMITIGAGFKLALAPFHMWTPDVYEGAPAPTAAFIATVSKGGVFALILRYFNLAGLETNFPSLYIVFVLLSIASMLTGNLLALFQKNLKRILACSSIAHLGYLFVAFLSSGGLALTAAGFYIASYFITMVGAFGVISVLSGSKEAGDMQSLSGIAWRRPWLAGILSAMLFSLAGIPLTVGFLGKFYLVLSGVGSARWLLVFSLIVNSAIGIFYYMRVVAAMYAGKAEAKAHAEPRTTLGSGLVLAALSILLVLFGVYPSVLIEIVRRSISGLIRIS